jgi:hypothetical protein
MGAQRSSQKQTGCHRATPCATWLDAKPDSGWRTAPESSPIVLVAPPAISNYDGVDD